MLLGTRHLRLQFPCPPLRLGKPLWSHFPLQEVTPLSRIFVRLCGQIPPCVCFCVVLFYPFARKVAGSEIDLGKGVALSGSFEKPFSRFYVVLNYATGFFIGGSKTELGLCVTLLGCFAIPFDGLCGVVFHTCARAVSVAKSELSVCAAFFSRSPVFFDNLRRVRLYGVTRIIGVPDSGLSKLGAVLSKWNFSKPYKIPNEISNEEHDNSEHSDVNEGAPVFASLFH